MSAHFNQQRFGGASRVAHVLSVTLMLAVSCVLPVRTTYAAVPRPDLTVTSVWSKYAGDGDTWYMYYTVRNAGNANAGDFRITLKNSYTGQVMQDFVTSGLASGASRTYRHTVGHCEFDRQIKVDSDNRIVESNEANNSRSFTNLC